MIKNTKKRKPKRIVCDPELKYQMFLEANGQCARCKKQDRLDVHRLLRGKEGGTYVKENCVLLCRSCHMRAHATDYLANYDLILELMRLQRRDGPAFPPPNENRMLQPIGIRYSVHYYAKYMKEEAYTKIKALSGPACLKKYK